MTFVLRLRWLAYLLNVAVYRKENLLRVIMIATCIIVIVYDVSIAEYVKEKIVYDVSMSWNFHGHSHGKSGSSIDAYFGLCSKLPL